jgi:hypothetical protein
MKYGALIAQSSRLHFLLCPGAIEISGGNSFEITPIVGASHPLVSFVCGEPTRIKLRLKYHADLDDDLHPEKAIAFAKEYNKLDPKLRLMNKVKLEAGFDQFECFVERVEHILRGVDSNGTPWALDLEIDLIHAVGGQAYTSQEYSSSESKPETKPKLSNPRCPRTGGKWLGEPGDSPWQSSNPLVNRDTQGKPIPFKKGYPDFGEWSRKNYEFENLCGNNDIDFSLADKRLAEELGFKNQSEATRYRINNKLTWHHHQDGKTMQLVPRGVHNFTPHSGGASGLRSEL